ncbi:MAG TPA: hypothetical protein PKK11_02225 [Methanothrix sp.]|nr:hypothetical protein [Methanothrix sp.]HPT19520.1 hypothetical protein [Methanothrix sp.]
MKRLLPVLVLIAVAISGCTEKGPDTAVKSIDELKNLSVSSAENLTSFSVKSSMTQVLKLHSGANATEGNITTVTESAETTASVNLTTLQAHAEGSTKNEAESGGKVLSSISTKADVYQMGNVTLVNDESGNWTRLEDPRSADEVWGQDKNNQIKTMAETLHLAETEDLGSEAVDGEDAYKISIVAGSDEFLNLYNSAFTVAAKITQYPMYLPSINKTELNETAKMEKTIWISKKSGLPVRYKSLMSFTMTPEIIGALNTETRQMVMLNQSVRLGKIEVSIESTDDYLGFDAPLEIMPPAEALSAPAFSPAQVQSD